MERKLVLISFMIILLTSSVCLSYRAELAQTKKITEDEPLTSTALQTDMPVIFIDPPITIANPGDTITISIKAFNLSNTIYLCDDLPPYPPYGWVWGELLPPYNADGRFNYSLGNLAGLDIRFSWDSNVLEYLNHTVKVPVETYPDGILHEPILDILEDLDTAEGEYSVAKVSWQSDVFNKPDENATIFEMTFNVSKHGRAYLNITSSDLAVPIALPSYEEFWTAIPHWVNNGEFRTEIPATRILSLDVGAFVDGAFNDPIMLNEDIQIDAIILNEGEIIDYYNLSLTFDNNILTSWTGRTLLPDESETLSWVIPAIDTERGAHVVTAEATILHGVELRYDELTSSCQVIDTPQLVVDGPNFARQGESVAFSGSNSSHNDPDGEIWNYTWSLFRFGESDPRVVAIGETVNFQIDCQWLGGLYEVVLHVRDNFGGSYDERRPGTAPYQCRVNLTIAESKPIYINIDGSIDPPYAPIVSSDNITYTFTDDILHPTYNSISIEKSNIIINGNDHTLQGCKNALSTELRFGYGFTIYSNNVTITNTTIKNFGIGILVSSSNKISDCVFSGNKITNNSEGIVISSFYYFPPTNYTSNLIKGNVIANNGYGLRMAYSHNNTISANVFTNNSETAFTLYNCTNNIISDNNITKNNVGLHIYTGSGNILSSNHFEENEYSFGVYGRTLDDFLHTITTSNTINGKPIYYLMNQTNLTINPETYPEIGYLALINCTNITIEGLKLVGNLQGLLLVHTNNSIVSGNSMFDNYMAGIEIYSSYNNNITNNLLMQNIMGLRLFDSSNNKIYHNTFLHMFSVEIYGYSIENQWDDGYPSGGNFWIHYRGTDLFCGFYQNETGIDGVGDIPYRIQGKNIDRYPLMKPFFWWNFADINLDLKVDISDIVLALNAYKSIPGDANWNSLADVAPQWNRIDIFDLVTIAFYYGEEY